MVKVGWGMIREGAHDEKKLLPRTGWVLATGRGRRRRLAGLCWTDLRRPGFQSSLVLRAMGRRSGGLVGGYVGSWMYG